MKKFTLLELIIVIAIIGILVTLLMPSLEKAREAARHAVCVSNKKQHYTAIYVFSKNNNGKYPRSYPYIENPIDIADIEGNWYGTKHNKVEMVNPILTRYAGENIDFLRCPSIEEGVVGSGNGSNGLYDQAIIGAFSHSFIAKINNRGFVWPDWEDHPVPFVIVEKPNLYINKSNMECNHGNADERAVPHNDRGSYISMAGNIVYYEDKVPASLRAASFWIDMENGKWESLQSGVGNWHTREGTIDARK